MLEATRGDKTYLEFDLKSTSNAWTSFALLFVHLLLTQQEIQQT